MNKKTKFVIIPVCVLFACWFLYKTVPFCIFLVNAYPRSEVAKKIQSPDKTKTALLIRRAAMIDLNFIVNIKEGSFSKKTLHVSRDFLPDRSADYKEELIWSDDSSFLIMSVDDPFDNSPEKYMWAYDFKDNKEYTDETTIMGILNSRNEGKENAVEARYQW